jgi:hypothetical protein
MRAHLTLSGTERTNPFINSFYLLDYLYSFSFCQVLDRVELASLTDSSRLFLCTWNGKAHLLHRICLWYLCQQGWWNINTYMGLILIGEFGGLRPHWASYINLILSWEVCPWYSLQMNLGFNQGLGMTELWWLDKIWLYQHDKANPF